ncbi:MAG TPA: dihydroxyacetone kinase subunit DhaL [Candidatus Limnocylindria bacterium]
MNGSELVALLDRALGRLATSRDELRDLDAAMGDGDLGITVGKACEAVRARLPELADPTPASVLRTAGAQVASANPSTMGALAGGALLAAAKAVGEAESLDRDLAVAALRAAQESIATRGKSAIGDKTILDAIAPSLVTLEEAAASGGPVEPVLDAMIEAARRGVEETAALQSRRGRASWLGERSSGHPDPGATAYLRLLEALRTCWRPGEP